MTPPTYTDAAREWDRRPCWICRAYGHCAHRELEVELELIAAEWRKREK